MAPEENSVHKIDFGPGFKDGESGGDDDPDYNTYSISETENGFILLHEDSGILHCFLDAKSLLEHLKDELRPV